MTLSGRLCIVLVLVSLILAVWAISITHESAQRNEGRLKKSDFRRVISFLEVFRFIRFKSHFPPRWTEKQQTKVGNVDVIEKFNKNTRRLATPLDPKSVEYKNSRRKPIIYTFYEPVAEHPNGRGTGMTKETDEDMIAFWAHHWTKIGWEPRILNLTHAKMHPRYKEFYKKVDQIPLLGKKRAGINKEYNMYCYLRWLAMASIGGGFMSDYDVVPFRPVDSTIGSFTVYSSGNDGRGIPCLMSGTDDEWSNMAFAIVENGLLHLDADLWSDMWALMDIREIMPYFSKQTVMEATKLLTGKPWTDAECKLLNGKDAIHFSHNSLVTGVKREGETFKDRPRIATNVLHLIGEKCLGRDSQTAF